MDAKDRYNYFKGKRASANAGLEEAKFNRMVYQEELEALQVVGWLLTEAAILTQQKLKAAYENTVTAALNEVFDQPHVFELEFDRRGQRLECTATVRSGGMVLDPRSEKGGSIVDVISFAARLAEWVLGGRKSRPIFFMDEPFKNLGSSSYIDRAMAVIRKLCNLFEVQLIIITHTDQLSNLADSHYVLSHDGTKTIATLKSVGGKSIGTQQPDPTISVKPRSSFRRVR